MCYFVGMSTGRERQHIFGSMNWAESLGTFIGYALIFVGMGVGGAYVIWWLVTN